MHQYLATLPFDLYELHLLLLIAKHGSFTRAAAEAGLTQSAITRQVQGVESRLDLALFERTTRKVIVTPAGEFLLREGSRIVGDLDAVQTRLREQFGDRPREVKVGVSQTIGLSYLPGLFAAQRKRCGDVGLRIFHQPSATLIARVESNELDVAILCAPKRVPPSLRVAHRFDDAFVLIAPPDAQLPRGGVDTAPARWREWLAAQQWLLIHAASETGGQLRAWLRKRGWAVEEDMELDSFDLIINMVALGQGISLVPQRALALYVRRRKVQRVAMNERFSREVAVVIRRNPAPPEHVSDFVKNVLF